MTWFSIILEITLVIISTLLELRIKVFCSLFSKPTEIVLRIKDFFFMGVRVFNSRPMEIRQFDSVRLSEQSEVFFIVEFFLLLFHEFSNLNFSID